MYSTAQVLELTKHSLYLFPYLAFMGELWSVDFLYLKILKVYILQKYYL